MSISRRDVLKGAITVGLAAGVGRPHLRHRAQAPSDRPYVPAGGQLANLDHIDFLRTTVSPPNQPGHTTYRLADDPSIGVLWVYANFLSPGSYQVVGGGTYDAATNTYGQGAFDTDDISRAAVVYLRHWRQHGDAHSRDAAYQLLRGLTYLQTSSGPNAGNVVLWMQPDGTLNPTPTPPDSPNPSDTGPSYWLGRTIWALGEGYRAFRRTDPAFAAFLSERFILSLGALEREVLNAYGTYLEVNGRRVPAWLLVGGADASSETCLGLAAYAESSGDGRTKTALGQLAHGISEMAAGSATTWPFGAILPDVTNLSLWHAYADQMAGALVLASTVLGDTSLMERAVTYGAEFAPHLIIQGGPDNEWLPSPVPAAGQISYGAYCIFSNLLLLEEHTGRAGYGELAAFAASWWFGNNEAGSAMYDPANGVCFDGVSPTGVNMNSGAESTICALLGMIALDRAGAVAENTTAHTLRSRISWQSVDASSGTLSGAATLVQPPSSGTAESQWDGPYVQLQPSGATTMTVTLPVTDRYLLLTVLDRRPIPRKDSGTVQRLAGLPAGVAYGGGAGPQGDGAYPDELVMVTGRTTSPTAAGPAQVRSTYTGDGSDAALNAVLVQPETESLVLGDSNTFRALVRGFSPRQEVVSFTVPGGADATISSYESKGRLVKTTVGSGGTYRVPVQPGGFTVVTGHITASITPRRRPLR
jgi:hypothetical protein